jgi:hypothetical protein
VIGQANERYMSNPDDVAANRSGTLTERQRRQAGQIFGAAGCTSGLVLVVVAGVVLGIPFVMLWREESEPLALLVPALLALLVGVPLALWVAMQLIRLWLTRQDLAAGDVQQADGVVAWRRRRYAAEFPGRAFWTNNSVTALPPGPYRFYYLPRSGYVLSAQPLPGMMTAGMTGMGETAGLDQVLGSVVGFSAGDVEANRDGRLGAGQVARMVAAMAGLGVVVVLLLAFCGFMAWNIWSDADAGSTIPIIMVALIALGGLLALGWSIIKLGLDVLGGRVEMVEGPVQRTYARAGRSTNYYYQVGGQKFSVSLRAYQAMVSGQNFRVYFGPRSKRLLALESLGGGS